jgi:hypothetical protein
MLLPAFIETDLFLVVSKFLNPRDIASISSASRAFHEAAERQFVACCLHSPLHIAGISESKLNSLNPQIVEKLYVHAAAVQTLQAQHPIFWRAKDEEAIFNAIISQNISGIRHMPLSFDLTNPTFKSSLIALDPHLHTIIPPALINRDFALEVVSLDGWELEFLEKKYKDDEEIVKRAGRADPRVVQFSSPRLRDSASLIEGFCKIDGRVLQFASERLKAEKQIVAVAVKSAGYSLIFADPRLRLDRDFCLNLVQNNGMALEFVAEQYKRDDEIVYAAVENDPLSLQFAAIEYRKDKKLGLQVVARNPNMLRTLDCALRNDRDLAFLALSQDGNLFGCLSDRLQNDAALQQLALKKCDRKTYDKIQQVILLQKDSKNCTIM